MRTRAWLGACVAAACIASGAPSGSSVLLAAAQQPASPPQAAPAPADLPDDDVTIRAFLQNLESIVRAADFEAFAALEGPLGSRDEALEFAKSEFWPGATRVVIQERDRQDVTLSGIPGSGYGLTVDAFIEFGNQARIATWQLFVRPSGDSWALIRQQVMSSVDNLFRLTLNGTRQFQARDFAIRSEDLELTMAEGTVFRIDADQGITGLVVMGRGEMHFAPAPDSEKGQVRIFAGSEVLDTKFDAAFIRVGSPGAHFDASLLSERPVDARDLKRAQQIFREESAKSFAVDLADLTRDTWTLLPGTDDFLAEIRTKRFNTLTYARSASEPEDISVFERRRKRNIALYASKEKLGTRGRFYNEDDLASFDVLDYDIDVTALPDRQWVEGRTRMRVKVRSSSLGQLTIRLADSLVVRSITSDKFGRMFSLRVTNQNTVLVNLPTLLVQDAELTLTIAYGGRLEPQTPDRETLAVQDTPAGQGGFGTAPPDFVPDILTPKPEPSFLYSNRSYWYPQSTVSDYATASIRLTIPLEYGCVASGTQAGPPEVLLGKNPADARHVYVFKATRPARYLSFMISRFVQVDQAAIDFGEGSPEHAIDGQGGGLVVPPVALSVEANPRQTKQGKQLSLRAADIIRYYESIVDDAPYPSFTIALVENLTPGGHSPPYFAQLNQPLPNSPLTWRNDPAAFENYPEFFMAHEIAHQWWGHGVGWQNYHDQWISEGFAQYFAALYASHFRGDDVFQGILRRMRRWALDESDQGAVYLGYRVGHIRNDGRAFRAIIYNKSAMVLHMLRVWVGDDAFFAGLRRFYTASRFHKAGSEDFRAAMEAETGKDLSRFFERWIYGTALPQIAFSYRVEAEPAGQAAVLRFEQTGDIFDLPATVTLSYADGRSSDVVVPVTDRVVEVRVPLTGALRAAAISRRDVSLAEYR